MAQKFEKIVEEDLNIGTGAVWVTAPGGGQIRSTQVGLHSVARGQVAYDAAWTPGAIAAGSNASTTLAVTESVTGDFVMASHDKMLSNALRISGHVSVAGTVKVVMHNPTAAAITVAAGTVTVLVFPGFDASVTPLVAEFTLVNNSPGIGLVDFTDATSGGAPGYTYAWDFGDASASSAQSPSHTYSLNLENPETFTVTLTVTDSDGTVDAVSHDVTVTWVE